jgi:hypothetical protein
MFSKELSALTTLGTQFAQAFTDLAKATVKSANDEIDTIYQAAGRLNNINGTQNALLDTAKEIITAMEKVQAPLSQAIDRNETTLDIIDDMDWALEDEPNFDESDDDCDESKEELGE